MSETTENQEKLYTEEELNNAKQDAIRKRVSIEKQKRSELEEQVKALADQINELKQSNSQPEQQQQVDQQVMQNQQQQQPQTMDAQQQQQQPMPQQQGQVQQQQLADPEYQKMTELLNKGMQGDEEFAKLAQQSAHGQIVPGDIVLKLTSQFGDKALPALKKSLKDEDYYYRMLDAANSGSKHSLYKLIKENTPQKSSDNIIRDVDPDLMSEGSPGTTESSTKNRLRNIRS